MCSQTVLWFVKFSSYTKLDLQVSVVTVLQTLTDVTAAMRLLYHSGWLALSKCITDYVNQGICDSNRRSNRCNDVFKKANEH